MTEYSGIVQTACTRRGRDEVGWSSGTNRSHSSSKANERARVCVHCSQLRPALRLVIVAQIYEIAEFDAVMAKLISDTCPSPGAIQSAARP